MYIKALEQMLKTLNALFNNPLNYDSQFDDALLTEDNCKRLKLDECYCIFLDLQRESIKVRNDVVLNNGDTFDGLDSGVLQCLNEEFLSQNKNNLDKLWQFQIDYSAILHDELTKVFDKYKLDKNKNQINLLYSYQGVLEKILHSESNLSETHDEGVSPLCSEDKVKLLLDTYEKLNFNDKFIDIINNFTDFKSLKGFIDYSNTIAKVILKKYSDRQTKIEDLNRQLSLINFMENKPKKSTIDELRLAKYAKDKVNIEKEISLLQSPIKYDEVSFLNNVFKKDYYSDLIKLFLEDNVASLIEKDESGASSIERDESKPSEQSHNVSQESFLLNLKMIIDCVLQFIKDMLINIKNNINSVKNRFSYN